MELNQMLTWALSEASPSGDANMDMILRKVLKYRAMEEGGRGISDFITGGDKTQDLEDMNLKLEILQRKKQLGMDYDNSLEFEKDINGPDDAVKGVLSNRFANLADKRAKTAGNPQSMTALFKDAFAKDSPGHAAVTDRRKPYFKMAESAVGYGNKSPAGSSLLKKFLGGPTHGSSSSLWRAIIRK